MLFGGTPLAWKNLTHDPRRLVVACGGVSFAVLLMYIELGFLNALLDSLGFHLALASKDAA